MRLRWQGKSRPLLYRENWSRTQLVRDQSFFRCKKPFFHRRARHPFVMRSEARLRGGRVQA